MKRRPRKIITRVIVFLLLGAIVNVAVAWGYYCWPMSNVFTAISFDRIQHHWVDRAGTFVIVDNQGNVTEDLALTITVFSGDSENSIAQYLAGFPFRSVESFVIWEGNGRRVEGGFSIGDAPFVTLGCRPIWPGFAINTIFYAAILGLLFFAPGSVRRAFRRRRGLCPACAYPIGTSPVCTECGKPVTRRAIG